MALCFKQNMVCNSGAYVIVLLLGIGALARIEALSNKKRGCILDRGYLLEGRRSIKS